MIFLIPKYFRSDSTDNTSLLNTYFLFNDYNYASDESNFKTFLKEKEIASCVSFSTSLARFTEHAMTGMYDLNPQLWGYNDSRRYVGYNEIL